MKRNKSAEVDVSALGPFLVILVEDRQRGSEGKGIGKGFLIGEDSRPLDVRIQIGKLHFWVDRNRAARAGTQSARPSKGQREGKVNLPSEGWDMGRLAMYSHGLDQRFQGSMSSNGGPTSAW
jgi:hypothetical protein